MQNYILFFGISPPEEQDQSSSSYCLEKSAGHFRHATLAALASDNVTLMPHAECLCICHLHPHIGAYLKAFISIPRNHPETKTHQLLMVS